MSAPEGPAADPADVALVSGLEGRLADFNRAGILGPADIHVARRLGQLARESDEDVLLATALAVRAPRLGHVFADLIAVHATATAETDAAESSVPLDWPEPQGWVAAVAGSPLVACGEAATTSAPLRLLAGGRLYLDRLWREERALAGDLCALAANPPQDVDDAVLSDGLRRLFADDPGGGQATAAATAVLRGLTIVAGGPGTGKTSTVARIVALLSEQALHAGRPAPLVALAAPTGKAAARLEEAVSLATVDMDLPDPVRAAVSELRATTLHRLLGPRGGSAGRFRHDRHQRLPHDVVVVDETSMVSLPLMARLLEAVRPDARVILVGDPDQLVSIEAGAVLGDLVGPARTRRLLSRRTRERLGAITGTAALADDAPPDAAALADGITVLERIHRFADESGIARLAAAIRGADADGALEVLRAGLPDVRFLEADLSDQGPPGGGIADRDPLAPVRDAVLAWATAVREAAMRGDAPAALRELGAFRLLCAHRRGPFGVTSWTARTEDWLGAGLAATDLWYVGRPLLVTENDYELGLLNGDTGVVVRRADGGVIAVFERGAAVIERAPTRLSAAESVYAMTIHKSQGSQFDTAAVLLPEPGSPLLTRELLYTATTRASRRLLVAGSQEAVLAAVRHPAARASGLRERLWGTDVTARVS